MTLDSDDFGPLEIGRCAECLSETAPTPEWCPACWSDRIETLHTEGPGIVAASTVVHRGPRDVELPFGLAYVDVDERLRLMMRFDASDDQIVPGAPVRLSARPSGGPIPIYRATRVGA